MSLIFQIPLLPLQGHTANSDTSSNFRFEICKKLGQGTYGKVQLGINKETGQQVMRKYNSCTTTLLKEFVSQSLIKRKKKLKEKWSVDIDTMFLVKYFS